MRDLLVDGEGGGLPYLPELPARGPGADMIGRAAGLLVDLHVDLQPSGWRFVDRRGHDAAAPRRCWPQDLDELAEAFDGYEGDLKVQVTGPWTLAAGIELNRGEKALADPGALRDLVGVAGRGLRVHLADVARLVPGARSCSSSTSRRCPPSSPATCPPPPATATCAPSTRRPR